MRDPQRVWMLEGFTGEHTAHDSFFCPGYCFSSLAPRDIREANNPESRILDGVVVVWMSAPSVSTHTFSAFLDCEKLDMIKPEYNMINRVFRIRVIG